MENIFITKKHLDDIKDMVKHFCAVEISPGHGRGEIVINVIAIHPKTKIKYCESIVFSPGDFFTERWQFKFNQFKHLAKDRFDKEFGTEKNGQKREDCLND